MTFHRGQKVHYFSTTNDKWIDATVVTAHTNGEVTLDVKAGRVPARKVKARAVGRPRRSADPQMMSAVPDRGAKLISWDRTVSAPDISPEVKRRVRQYPSKQVVILTGTHGGRGASFGQREVEFYRQDVASCGRYVNPYYILNAGNPNDMGRFQRYKRDCGKVIILATCDSAKNVNFLAAVNNGVAHRQRCFFTTQ
mmetsp:Transcript_29778/g.61032  ORF Transcript_29778/g.61032 Transcript_29778/m.61032 type:complete len:196 (-) Transcript_29778:78-665(-)